MLFVLLAGAPPATAAPEPAGGREDLAPHETPLTSLPAVTPRPKPLVGERLSFHGRWFGIPVGYGFIEVHGITEFAGRQVYQIEVEGRSADILSTFYPIHDVVHSFIDVETLQPLRFEKRQSEGHYRADEIVTFDYVKGSATYRSLLNEAVKEIPITPDVQDLISALYLFRARPLQGSQTITMNLYTDEKIYQTAIEVKRPVMLELLKRGTFPCFVVEPKASFKGFLVKRGRAWAYLTADERRLPLLIKVITPWGPMSAVLDEASLKDPLHAGGDSAGP